MTRHEIYKEFRAGMLCAIAVQTVPKSPSMHWTAGWKAGKDAMHEKLDAYLVLIGEEKMSIIRPAAVKP